MCLQARKKVVTTVSTTVVALYIAGALVATACILEAAPHFAPGQSIPRRSTYAIIGATLWPILVVFGAACVGVLIELGAVMAFAKRVQSSAAENDLRLVKR